MLVTGADGRIGRATVEALVAGGSPVTALSPAWRRPSAADRVVTGDATDEADVAHALRDVDAVVHLGAIAHRDLAAPYEVYRTNTDATFNVLAQAGTAGVKRAVIASSINAFGVPMSHHDVLPAYFPIDEEIPARLDDWYSLSKRSDELTAQMAASRWGMGVVAIRFPHVNTAEELRRLSTEAAAAPAALVREGWSYLDLRDAVDVILASLVADVRGDLVVGVAASDTLIDEDSSELLDRFAPDVARTRAIPGRSSLIDTTRAERHLGFSPRYSVHQSLESKPSTIGIVT